MKLNAGDVLNEDIIIYQNTGYSDIGGVEIGENARGMQYDNTSVGMDYNKGDYLMSRISRGINLSLAVTYKF